MMKYAIVIPVAGFLVGVIAIHFGIEAMVRRYNKTFGYRRVSR